MNLWLPAPNPGCDLETLSASSASAIELHSCVLVAALGLRIVLHHE